MRRQLPVGATLAAILALAACHDGQPAESWLGDLTPGTGPAGTGSRYPHLATGDDGRVVLSWLQAQPQGGFALQHAAWRDGHWSGAATVASGVLATIFEICACSDSCWCRKVSTLFSRKPARKPCIGLP